MTLHECARKCARDITRDRHPKDRTVTGSSGTVKADLARTQYLAHPESHGHRRNARRASSGRVDTLDDDRIVAERDNSCDRIPELFARNLEPARERGLVERDMAVIPDSAVADIDAADTIDHFA